MSRYDYFCPNHGELDLVWGKEYDFAKAPAKSKCPECGEKGERFYGDQDTAIHFKGMDFHVNKSRQKRYNKDGMDKDSADKFLHQSIKNSKKHLDDGWQQYSKVELNHDVWVDKGLAHKKTTKEIDKSKQRAKELTLETNRMIGRDNPADMYKKKPQ